MTPSPFFQTEVFRAAPLAADEMVSRDLPEDPGRDYEGVFAPINAIDKAESAADSQQAAGKRVGITRPTWRSSWLRSCRATT